MGYIVQLPSGSGSRFDTIADGFEAQVNDTGHLLIVGYAPDGQRTQLAVYAPSTWLNCRWDGLVTHSVTGRSSVTGEITTENVTR